ncbi:MAG TPA: DegV family protein [Erysipelothrix sp.]|nr:DegV family protein [Erysipelothrix sp.]
MKVAVLIDSGSNYYGENIVKDNLFCVPLQVIDGTKGYREGLEITSLETYDMIDEGKMLKTSGPLVGDIEEMVDHIIELGYDAIFGVNITTGLSSTISTVSMICNQKEVTYDYFDCWTTARVQLQCALKAVDMFNEGKSFSDVKEELQTMVNHSNTFVIPTDMDHLVRGGRLTPIAAKLAGLLKIVPVLYLNETTKGRIESFKKVRTFKKALETVIQDMIDEGVDETYKVCVVHVKDEKAGQLFFDMIKERIPQADAYLVDLVSVVGVHTGVGCVAMQYVKK